MSDLISRSALIKILEENCNSNITDRIVTENNINLIMSISAAYNLDKIIERLEEELKFADEEKERCIKENPLQFDSAKGYANGIYNAIKILKAGGVDGSGNKDSM